MPQHRDKEAAGPTAADRALNILVIDDEARIRQVLERCLERDGHRVTKAASAEEAQRRIREELFQVAFLDVRLGSASGIELIPELLEQAPGLKIIVITAFASIESAVEAMRRGASDYLPKPFSPEQVRLALEKSVQLQQLENRLDLLASDLARARPEQQLESQNPAMQQLLAHGRQVAESEATVLIRGESGVGKGVLARAMHAWSNRAGGPFVVLHIPSVPSDLFESELFGHVKGAFTGATRANPGRISQAEGGTLFLDEIAELPLALQSKLLRFAQSQEFERVGEPVTRRADVRLLAATNQDLEQAVEEGRFRKDLLYRINVIELEVPPLRERPEDIHALAHMFLQHFAEKNNRPAVAFTPEAEEALLRYSWPGNVRELENVVERAVILCSAQRIGLAHLPFAGEAAAAEVRIGAPVAIEEVKRAHVRAVLARTETIEEAAAILDLDPSTLWRMRKRYGWV